MGDMVFMKAAGGALVPADDQTRDVVSKWKLGQGVRVKANRMRDLMRHRKFFAMLNLGFESWEPTQPEKHADGYRGEPIQKNFERFRKDVMILAGFYEPVYSMKGEVRLEAKSIAFGNMDQDEFEDVYTKVCDVLLQKVLRNYTRDDLDRVVEEMLRFGQ